MTRLIHREEPVRTKYCCIVSILALSVLLITPLCVAQTSTNAGRTMPAAVLKTATGQADATIESACPSLPGPRLLTEVNPRLLVSLQGNVHPLARPQYDRGRVDDSLPLEHMILMLRRSLSQEQALTTRIEQMHNPASPYFHQWLTAEQIGECYGVADADVARVTGWLQTQGFHIDTIPANKMMIFFTGTAGQVRNAFKAEIHHLEIRGAKHIANISEPQVPAALAPVISGFRSLNDFFPRPMSHIVGPIQRQGKTGQWRAVERSSARRDNHNEPGPLITFGYGDNTYWAVGPQDFYTIYNERPLLTASQPVNGGGQTIAIVQESDVDPDDVTSFRAQFELPAYPSTPNNTQGGVNYLDGINNYCSDPGIVSDVEGEADIDVQWAGATAPNAIIDFVSCASTSTTAGVDLSASYIVNNLASTVSAFSVSFGVCEAQLPNYGFGTNSFYNTLWQQAVAEGQTPLIAAGDSGDDVCDRGDDIGDTGLSVSGLASTPYDVAAGGTDFSDSYQTDFTPTAYWNNNDNPPYGSALSYVPEMAWNNTCGSTILVDYIRYALGITYTNGAEGLCNDYNNFNYEFTILDGGSGGISSIYTLPGWQNVYGVGLSTNYTSATMRNLPDVSMFASDGSLWQHVLVFCESDLATCDYGNPNDIIYMAAGGTSFVAPMLNGILGLINQATASRQGQANYEFYALASHEYGSPSAPNTSTTAPSLYTCEGSNVNAISTYGSIFRNCVFYDLNRTAQYQTNTCVGHTNTDCLIDNNDQPCETGTTNCYTNTGGDFYGLLSTSTTSFRPACPQSAGYSAATGLGSVNVMNLVNGWSSVQPQYSLTVSTTGSGRVTSTDGYIDCPGTCSHSYVAYALVTLNAHPAQGWTFSGWGGACSGTGSCNVTVTASTSVSATFTNSAGFNLSIVLFGGGTVASTDGSIQCPGTCSHNYTSGTHVTLNATPTTGYHFIGWGNACSGTGQCAVVMSQNVTVDGTFNQGGSFSTVLTFTSSNGAHLFGGVVQGSNGNLYGTTADGGAHSDGTVFAVTTGGSLSTLYNFCSQSGCSDGLVPQSGLVMANDGNFYGTTNNGGANNLGTVFQITPSGTLTTLYSFDGAHGANPAAALIQATDGNLYGTTNNGGLHDRGTIFKITTGGTLTLLHSFCSSSGCGDGIGPSGGLIQASDGNFYGTTVGGGASHRGSIYKLVPSGTLTTLHSFELSDGSQPTAGLVQGFDGNLYGTTYGGGAHNWGTVFKIATSGGTLATLYSFAHTDGALPDAPLLQGSDGNLYGTTFAGGLHDKGTVFEITTGGSLTTLYTFGFTDGANPQAGLVEASDGNLYGTTYEGGAHDFGIVFRLPVP